MVRAVSPHGGSVAKGQNRKLSCHGPEGSYAEESFLSTPKLKQPNDSIMNPNWIKSGKPFTKKN